MRRLEIGPLLVALGALLLLVSLFLEWYGDQTAWEAFELTDVLLALIALGAIATAAGLLAPRLAQLDRRWLPALAIAAAVLVIAQLLSPPPAAAESEPDVGAWLAFGAALGMLAGAVLSVGRISFSVSIEGREPRRRVAAVDHRPPPTESGEIVARPEPETAATEPIDGTTGAGEPVPGKPRRGARKA